MSTRYDNSSDLTNIIYDGTELDKVIYDTTTVYQRITVNYYCENTIYKSTKVVSSNNIDLSSSNAASKSGWSFIGWRLDKTASSSVQSSITAGTSTINLYAVYRQTISVTYNGNGATSGSTASQSGYRYYNNGSTTNPSFTLRSNGFSRTNYSFVNWRMGSSSGTVYNAGATVTLSSNTVFYAYWQLVYTASTLTLWGGGNYAHSDGLVPLFSKPAHNTSDVSSDSTLTGNTISLVSGDTAYIKANVACTVNISGTLYFKGADAYAWYCWKIYIYIYIYIYINSSSYSKILDGGNYSGSSESTKSWSLATSNISLNAGDTVRIMIQGGDDGSTRRTMFYTQSPHITITATPR